MSRSSIFNFEGLKLDGKRPAGLLAALAVLAGVEVVARGDWIWAALPQSDSGVLDAVERQVIARAPAPRVVIMGNSRVRDAYAPRALERELALAQGSVLNLGLTAGTTHDALWLYRRNRERLARARVLVVNVDEWHFNKADPPNDRDRRFLTLAERWNGFARADAQSLAVGWLWRTYDARHVLRSLLDPSAHRPLRFEADGRIAWREDAALDEVGPVDVAANIREKADAYYLDYEPSAARIGALQETARLARADGLDVLLVHLPHRAAFVRYVKERYADHYATFKERLAAISGVALAYNEQGGELGLEERQFYDYGHVTASGCRVLTTALARELRGRFGRRLALDR